MSDVTEERIKRKLQGKIGRSLGVARVESTGQNEKK